MALVGQNYSLLDAHFDLKLDAMRGDLRQQLMAANAQLAEVIADRSAVITEFADLARQTERVLNERNAARFQLTCAQRKVEQLQRELAELRGAAR